MFFKTNTMQEWTPERIRALRHAMGLTQPQFAERLGYERFRTVTELESGARQPTRQAQIILAMLAEKTPDFEAA